MDIDLENDIENDGQEIESHESDNEEELEAVTKILEDQITENVFSYQAHVDLIVVLKKLADLERLRMARDRMSKHFPLTAELWLDWLEDEIKIAGTSEERVAILSLFERAVKDYLSIEIWHKYVEFVKEIFGKSNVGEVRKVCERSLTAGGLHVTKGSMLWHSFIDYEKGLLQEQKDNSKTDMNQLKFIANLYKRLLSCPLMEIEDNFQKFSFWLNEQPLELKDSIVDISVIESVYKKSKDKLKKIKQYEEAIIADSEHAAEHYKMYLDHEKSKYGAPVRVQFLYERMASDFCLHEEVWTDYINFVNTVLKNGEFAIDVIQRSLRNCPWSCRLYQLYIQSLERYHHKHETITGAFEQAVASGLQTATDFRDIWMTYLEYLRRRIDELDISKEEERKRLEELRKNFAKALEFLSQLDGSDPEFVISQFWARIEAIYGRNMEKCRSLWTDILTTGNLKTSEMWLEFINIERAYGDSKHLRKLLPRALQNTNDFPELIAKVWLNYERDEGTLESYENCMEKIKLKFTQMKAQREREERQAEDENGRQNTKKSKRQAVGFKKETVVLGPGSNAVNDNKQVTSKKRKLNKEAVIEDIEESPGRKTRKEENEDLVNKLLQESNKGHGVTVSHDSSKDNRTVFVSNLDFLTEEPLIRELFETCGKITDLRLVKDYKGRSKGYCYVEFETPSHALAALKKDRQPINGRPVFVSKCDPDKETRGKVFKYSSNMEKNKLFIRGLPFTTTEDDLRELFSQYGSLKDVRLVTYRNGHSKGLAYVDYQDEVSAAQAILKTDGMTIGDRQISVAISNPPDRKPESLNKPVLSLGGGHKDVGPRGRGRTQISFVPRSVKLSTSTHPTDSMANLSIISPLPTENFKQLSNADFRAKTR